MKKHVSAVSLLHCVAQSAPPLQRSRFSARTNALFWSVEDSTRWMRVQPVTPDAARYSSRQGPEGSTLQSREPPQ
jgi:hypothetical protein